MARKTDYRSAEASSYRALYRTQRWSVLRKSILKRDAYTCQWPGCGKLLIGSRHQHNAPVVHHRHDHKGDLDLFYNPANLMAVCKACHDSQAQRTGHTGFIAGNGIDGRPLDPNHPWNRAHEH